MARQIIAIAIAALGMPLVPLSAQSGPSVYPNVDKSYAIAPGDTVRLLIRFMNDGGPAMRTPHRRLELIYSTAIPASDVAGRRAQADRAAQMFGGDAAELGARHLSIGICDTPECAQRKHPPASWYLYERTNGGWKRVP